LTDPTKTKKWWNVSFVTDWKAGSVMDVKMDTSRFEILNNHPGVEFAVATRLHWHTFSPSGPARTATQKTND